MIVEIEQVQNTLDFNSNLTQLILQEYYGGSTRTLSHYQSQIFSVTLLSGPWHKWSFWSMHGD
jgi:hypothetical protein